MRYIGMLLLGLLVWLPACTRTPQDNIELVLCVGVDCLRPDHMGLFGYDRDTTPKLSAARHAMWWCLASSQSNQAPAGHAGLLAGRCIPATAEPPLLGPYSLPALLRSRGFTTIAIPANQEMDRLLAQEGVFDRLLAAGTDAPLACNQIVDRALAQLEMREPGQKLFLWLHFSDCRPPFMGRDFRGLMEAQDTTPLPFLYDVDSYQAAAAAIWRQAKGPESFVQSIAWYDAAVYACDQSLGRLRDLLAQTGLANRSVTILYGANGLSLGEHDSYYSCQGLYQETLQVPITVIGPVESRHITGPASLADVVPTVAKLLSLPYDSRRAMGQNLTAPQPDRLIFSCSEQGWAARQGDDKLICLSCRENTYAFFNLAFDPAEQVNLLQRPDRLDTQCFARLRDAGHRACSKAGCRECGKSP